MNIMKYITYAVAALFILLGAAILSGYFVKQNVPGQFRVMVGIVLILYGAFRIIYTYFKKNETSET